MDIFKSLLETAISLAILVFLLAAIRKVIMFYSAKAGLTGVTSFLS